MYVFVVAVVGKMAKVVFQVPQGSVATHVRCGGKRDNDFSANSLLIVKK